MNNEYDKEEFFKEYAKMARSRDGLSAAGEWHQLKPLFPSLAGKNVLDLGCGYGWHCIFAARQGPLMNRSCLCFPETPSYIGDTAVAAYSAAAHSWPSPLWLLYERNS